MAAEKLTRGRFVQIIIMLTLLVSAFFWRTIDHSSQQSASCFIEQECVFYVNESRFVGQFNRTEGQLQAQTSNVSLEVPSSQIKVTQKGDFWTFSYPESLKEWHFTVNVAGQNKKVVINTRR
ncbi:hypothetical protein [Vibrio sinaloensis]|uniref:hypothetical protein n=1 Tax=Photobacterium sp. (strain ATCC 43367) TaxID=379097 RepID=UPI002060DF31|nr:hypothetical protein [Vibrio sinaloensis]UPQ86779.1 hypothetical protein MTO69_06970 [Vibrio sinaloensis]